eukprot:maker-scaffold397_size184017-snap-gene-0.42 protein:Tk01050 transcript:maker-scaffold397_size184017-snap-gene-0.42-mRNA-1 annotation:"atp-binding domain-containing protein 3"
MENVSLATPGTPSEAPVDESQSPWHVLVRAAQYGELGRVEELLAAHAPWALEADADGITLLHWAAINNRQAIMRVLLRAGARVDAVGGELKATPLHWATRQGHLPAVVLLVRHRANPLILDAEGCAPIHLAAQLGHSAVLAYYIGKGVPVDALGTHQMTPLMCSRMGGIPCSAQCGRKAVLKRPKTRAALCQTCFFWAFETEIHYTIVKNQLFRPGRKVAIGASGGKDSTVLAHVLKTLNERYNYGLELVLLSIDEGISGYRDDSLETVQRNSRQYDLPLTILSYEELYGWSMDRIVSQIGRQNNCTFCGVFRRQALDRGAARLGVDQIVTGHNADDIAETVLMNILRGDVARLHRCTAITTQDKDSESTDLPRSKPFKFTYEKEIVMYAYFKGLDYFSTECKYSPNAYRGHARTLIKDLEKIRPSTIIDIINSGEDLKFTEAVSEKMPTKSKCTKCGYMSSLDVCKACLLLEGLNKGLPQLGVLGLVAYLKFKASSKKDTLHFPNWEKDVVYLVQVYPSPQVRSISPFAVKLETWLRLAGIKYENVYSLKPGNKGQTPYVELNGKQIPDSNLIIKYLKEQFRTNPDSECSESDKVIAHTTRVMVENHLAFIGFYWRYSQHARYKFIMENLVDMSEFNPWLIRVVSWLFPYFIRLRMYLGGISRHSEEEINEFSYDDLRAISTQLGSKPFYLGDKATSIDCTLFGHLAQFLYIPMDFPQKAFLKEHCSNIVDYVDRVRDKFWPDWDEMCAMKCTEGKLGIKLIFSSSKVMTIMNMV